MIPIEKAAKLYGTSVKTLRRWITQHLITYSGIGSKMMVDEKSLQHFLELNARISHFHEDQEEVLAIKEKQLAAAVLRIDSLLFLFKSLHEISPLLRAVMDEMSLLIPAGLRREVFVDMTLGKDLQAVAHKHNISEQMASYFYRTALKCVQSKLGFITGYRDRIAKLIKQNKELEIKNRNQKELHSYLIRTLNELKGKKVFPEHDFPDIDMPLEAVETLFMQLEKDLGVSTRTAHCLRWRDIETVEDLLRYLKTGKMEDFLLIKNFGKKSLFDLKKALADKGILEENGDSYLFKYLKVL